MSQLNFAGGRAVPTWGDPGIWYQAVARQAGRMLLADINKAEVGGMMIGFDDDQAAQIGEASYYISGSLIYTLGLSSWILLGQISFSTTYSVAFLLRYPVGNYVFIKGGAFANWTLLWHDAAYSGTPLYAAISNYNAAFTVDNMRIPTRLWLPEPLCYDDFSRADGTLGNSEAVGPDGQTVTQRAWTGATWSISGGKAINTPATLGADVVSNGNMETGDPPTGWTAGGGATLSSVADERTGGSGSKSLNIQNDGVTAGQASQAVTVSANTWHRCRVWGKNVDAGVLNGYVRLMNGDYSGASICNVASSTSWQEGVLTGRFTVSAGAYIFILNDTGASGNARYDDIDLQPLTLSELLSSVSCATVSVFVDVNIAWSSITQAGLALNLDSASNPQNLIHVYLYSPDGSSHLAVDKVVGGTYTRLADTAITYSADAALRVITYRVGADLKIRVYYAGAMIGSELTVSDAGIIDNTLHGLFSTSDQNSFSSFCVFPRGNGNEFSALDAF